MKVSFVQLAIIHGNTDLVIRLIKRGNKINNSLNPDTNHLHIAIENEKYDIIVFLLNKCARVYESHLRHARVKGNRHIIDLINIKFHKRAQIPPFSPIDVSMLGSHSPGYRQIPPIRRPTGSRQSAFRPFRQP